MTHYEQTNFKNIENTIIKKYIHRYLTKNDNGDTILYCKTKYISDVARLELHKGNPNHYKGIGILRERSEQYTYNIQIAKKDTRPYIVFIKK